MKKGFIFFSITSMALILVGVIVIAYTFFPMISKTSTNVTGPFQQILRVMGFDIGKGPYYIVDFDVTKGLGRNITIQWLLLEEDDKAPDYHLFYNASGEDETPISGTIPRIMNDVYEVNYELPDFKTRTVGIVVTKPGEHKDYKEEVERREVVVDFLSDINMSSFEDFKTLSESVIRSYLLGNVGEVNKWGSRIHLADNLIIVGFNKENVDEIGCGKSDPIAMPEECEGVACLCLCKTKGLFGTSEYCKDRVCFGFNEVDYFISENKELHYGARIPQDRFPGGEAYYLVLYGNCIPLLGPSWGVRDIDAEKISIFGKTAIKIAERS